MTTWLLEKQMETEPGVFEHGPEYDFEDDDTVFVLDSERSVLVGEFKPHVSPERISEGDKPRIRTRLHPVTDDLLWVDDSDIVDLAERPKLNRRVVDALKYARTGARETVTAEAFFRNSDSKRDSAEPDAHETDSNTAEKSITPTLHDVFTRQEGVEDADFSGETVNGQKVLADVSLRGATLSDASIENVTFRNVNLRDVDFRGAQLQGATFTGQRTQLGGADFTDAHLDGAIFEVDVSDCTFTSAQMRGVDLRDATLEGADFSGARLKRAKLHDTEPERATFDRAVMQDVKTKGAHFEKVSFVGANLYNTTFADTDFVDADFSNADLRDADFRGCTLEDVEFVGAKMADISLEDHETTNLDFGRSDLSNAVFSGSNFTSARFDEARLSDAKFHCCDLSGVSMTDVRADGAEFDEANLEYATLSQADLTDSRFTDARLYTCQLVSARVGTGTTFDGIYNYLDSGKEDGEEHPGRKAASVYRTLEAVYRDNSLTGESLKYHRKRKNATFRVNIDERRLFPVIVDGFLKHTTGHGTKLKPLFGWSIIFVVITALLHFALGTLEHETHDHLWLWVGDGSGGTELAHSILFSFLAFTGLGYGRFTPVGSVGEALAVGQTAFGILFFGLLVFVLSTRASR